MTDHNRVPATVMTQEESDVALANDIARRKSEMAQAMTLPPYAVLLGASNLPGDPQIWSADWREQLPKGHKARVEAEIAGELPVTQARSLEITRAAHATLLDAARRTGFAGPQ